MFIGREEYLERLDALWRKPVASLVTCRGRRRIGKSTLIAEFAQRSRARFLKLEGIPPHRGVDNTTQLRAFSRQLSEQAGGEEPPAENWFDAFARLAGKIKGRGKTVVLLDEISWMGKDDPSFPGELKYAWDNRFSRNANLVFVLCGSVSSWIDKNILKTKGFVGRPSLNLVVRELPLAEAAAFWDGGGASHTSVRDMVDILSVTGGVPKYLENIDPALSADENVKNLCYRSGGLLVDEFDEIFNDSLDENLALKRKMLVALADGPRTSSEIAETIGMDFNGHLSAHLAGLETAGFIAKDSGMNPATGRPSNLVRYRICDNYTRFYLKYIETRRDLIRKDAYRFISLEQLPGWSAVLGLQFECLVLNNIPAIISELGLGQTLLLSAAPYRQNATARAKGCQIDLLLQTRRGAYAVEIKRRESIGEEVVHEAEEKIARLKVRRDSSVYAVLVYEGRLSKRVEADGFFARTISAESLLRRK